MASDKQKEKLEKAKASAAEEMASEVSAEKMAPVVVEAKGASPIDAKMVKDYKFQASRMSDRLLAVQLKSAEKKAAMEDASVSCKFMFVCLSEEMKKRASKKKA